MSLDDCSIDQAKQKLVRNLARAGVDVVIVKRSDWNQIVAYLTTPTSRA